jgi:hypothetical protein
LAFALHSISTRSDETKVLKRLKKESNKTDSGSSNGHEAEESKKEDEKKSRIKKTQIRLTLRSKKETVSQGIAPQGAPARPLKIQCLACIATRPRKP